MQKSETLGELAKALAKAQAAIQPAPKDTSNPFFKSKYADLPAVWRACREPLASNGLSVVQMPADSSEGRIALTTMLLHTSGEYITSTVSTKIAKDDPQGVGSALTYLRRYALAAMVGIVADDDDDGNAASIQPQQQRQQPPRQPQREPSKRAHMLGRINGMFTEAKDRHLSLPDEIALTDPEQLTDGELQVFGVKFREVLNAAEAINA